MLETLHLPTDNKHIRIVLSGENDAMVYHDCFSPHFGQNLTSLYEVKRHSFTQHSILRYLSIQSYHLFESLQNNDNIDFESLVVKSREYRAILTECEDQLVNEIKLIEDKGFDGLEDRYNFMTTQCNKIRDYQLLWHLAEIFFIKSSPGGYFVRDLQCWLNLQQPHVSANYTRLIETYYHNGYNGDMEEPIETVELDYWPTVLCLALHGRSIELSKLLSCHSMANSQAVRTLRRIIEQLPLYDNGSSGNGNESQQQFESEWSQWHRVAVDQLSLAGLLSTDYSNGNSSGLQLLAAIVAGERQVLLEERVLSLLEGCHYYGMVPLLFYSTPLLSAKQLQQHNNNSYRLFKKDFLKAMAALDSNTNCDLPILDAVDSVFNLDLGEFISFLSRHSNDWWLLAHLVDLLEKTTPQLLTPAALPPLSPSTIFSGDSATTVSLREFFLLRYSASLCTDSNSSSSSSTMMALNYLQHCPLYGPANIRNIITHLQLPTDRMATMLHNWCVERKYSEVASSICRRQAVAAYKCNSLGNSLVWCLRDSSSDSSYSGGGGDFVSHIADRVLQSVLCEGVAGEGEGDSCDSSYDMLESVRRMGCLGGGGEQQQGKKMAFVMGVLEVRRRMGEGGVGEALGVLRELLEGRLVSSRRYGGALLRTVVRPLLLQLQSSRGEGPLLRSGDVYLLMELLEELQGERDSELEELRRLLAVQLSHSSLVDNK